MTTREKETPEVRLENDVSIHIFSASATMIGVCLMVIGVLHTFSKAEILTDELIAFDTLLFLAASFLSYFTLKETRPNKKRLLSKTSEITFLIGQTLLVIGCSFLIYEFAAF